MSDPRIDPLGNSAILTDTVLRLAFAPHDPKEKVTALKVPVRATKIDRLQSMMQLGTIHLQVKAGFAPERSIELTGPELMVLHNALDMFITELPRAQRATPGEEDEG